MKTLIAVIGLAFLSVNTLSAAPLANSKRQIAAREKPLTYSNVVAFFKKTGLRVTEVQKRCTIFFEGEWKSANIYNYAVIMVENSDEDIQITCYLTDAHEMIWVTEFIDSPFFSGPEKQALFDLLNRERGVREQIGPFKVEFNHWRPRHAEIIVFSLVRS